MLRFLPGLFAALAFASASQAGWVAGETKTLGTLPGGAIAWQTVVKNGFDSIKLTGVTFSEKDYSLGVIDNPKQSVRLSGAVPGAKAEAGINASYFHPNGAPLGLVVSGGQTVHGQERAKLLSGIIAVRNNRIEIRRSEKFPGTAGVTEAVQAGPWLVEKGAAVTGLNPEKRARRTAIAAHGGGKWSFISSTPTTLAGIAEILSTPGSSPQPVKEALNLDGGSSTALWAATNPAISIPEFGNVRNYLAITPRP